MNKLEQLKEIIDTARKGAGESKLSKDAIDGVGGYIAPNNRHLYNNLGAISTHYLECGSHVGSSLISTVYGNHNLKSAIGIDNFSLFDEGHNAKKDFLKHCDLHIPNMYKLLEKDYFTVTEKDIPNKIDLYLFDGAHDYESQKKGITYFSKFFAEETIVLIDDFNWNEPQQGTWDGMREAGLKIVWAAILDSSVRSDCGDFGWWNGTGIFLIKK